MELAQTVTASRENSSNGLSATSQPGCRCTRLKSAASWESRPGPYWTWPSGRRGLWGRQSAGRCWDYDAVARVESMRTDLAQGREIERYRHHSGLVSGQASCADCRISAPQGIARRQLGRDLESAQRYGPARPQVAPAPRHPPPSQRLRARRRAGGPQHRPLDASRSTISVESSRSTGTIVVTG